jgi:hypothetical protein
MMDSVIQFRGTIYENGYGLIARKVMKDKRIPKQAKLIYAYMCSYAGVDKNGDRTAFPSVKLQCEELGMNKDTYYKWREYLIDYGLITIEKRREQGKFERNLYIIEAVPVEKPEENEPYPNFSDTEPCPKNSDTVKSDTENQDTISNSSISNSSISEEEEELLTLANVNTFLNEQINKRKITNQKTITAIFEVADKCKAIGTTDRQVMENYCIRIVEDKMKLFGQNSSKRKPSQPSKSTRQEPVPPWLEENNEGNGTDQQNETSEDFEERKRALEERLKKYKKDDKDKSTE